jgi:outer membrane protein OmpA-like peptidoglycan-associated protein
MRQSSGWIGVRTAIVCGVVACTVFGQGPGTSQDEESLRHQAEAAASNGKWADAARYYQDAIAHEQDSACDHRGLADVYRANGAWAKAAEQYDAVTRIDSGDGEARQLASLTHQALAEQQKDVVAAATFTAMNRFSWSWSTNACETGGTRGIVAQQKPGTPAVERIPMLVAFPRNKYTLASLDPNAIRQLEQAAESIRTSSTRPGKIEVEGHTCACGSVAANNLLGRKRAETVRQFLISKRVAPAASISTVSYGPSRPVESAGAPNLPAAVCERDPVHSLNRRVVILVYDQSGGVSKASGNLHVSFLSRRAGARDYEPLPDDAKVHSDDEYLIRLHADKPVFAYAFHRQSNGKWMVLFPGPAARAGSAPLANPVESGRDVSLPSVLDNDPGVEETYIYSRLEPDKDLEALVGNINAGEDVRLLPPDVTEPATAAPGKLAPKPPAKAVVHVSAKAPAKTAVKPPPPPPSDTKVKVVGGGSAIEPVAGEDEVSMRGIREKDSGATARDSKGWPRLPPNPAAFVRFHHVN